MKDLGHEIFVSSCDCIIETFDDNLDHVECFSKSIENHKC